LPEPDSGRILSCQMTILSVRRPLLVGAVVCAMAGCYKNIPPVLAPERPVLEVAASFDATWTAVIDLFAERHIGIQLLDKPSGLIVAVPFEVQQADRDQGRGNRQECQRIRHDSDSGRADALTMMRGVNNASGVPTTTRASSRSRGSEQ